MIKVENLYKSFDGVQVLKDINVSYEPGKCNMIIGASGSGKTVLLKNLIGLMTPDSGEISYGDRKLSSMTEEEKRDILPNDDRPFGHINLPTKEEAEAALPIAYELDKVLLWLSKNPPEKLTEHHRAELKLRLVQLVEYARTLEDFDEPLNV